MHLAKELDAEERQAVFKAYRIKLEAKCKVLDLFQRYTDHSVERDHNIFVTDSLFCVQSLFRLNPNLLLLPQPLE